MIMFKTYQLSKAIEQRNLVKLDALLRKGVSPNSLIPWKRWNHRDAQYKMDQEPLLHFLIREAWLDRKSLWMEGIMLLLSAGAAVSWNAGAFDAKPLWLVAGMDVRSEDDDAVKLAAILLDKGASPSDTGYGHNKKDVLEVLRLLGDNACLNPSNFYNQHSARDRAIHGRINCSSEDIWTKVMNREYAGKYSMGSYGLVMHRPLPKEKGLDFCELSLSV